MRREKSKVRGVKDGEHAFTEDGDRSSGALVLRAHALRREKPLPREARAAQLESGSRLPQLETSLSSSEDLARPKINT
ncbi:unnamed protein product [Rangifer tarandus platyrhynchus]|uniref:Uncharacterized protein n=1 Tax=Rangifer tarandus platyrhynchus TaxID=3082113 RepID=A0AC59YKT0_RANTA